MFKNTILNKIKYLFNLLLFVSFISIAPLQLHAKEKATTLKGIKIDSQADSSIVKTPEYREYYKALKIQISEKAYSLYERLVSDKKTTGDVRLSFDVSTNGKISNIKILEDKSTKSKILRETAMKAVQSAAPFKPFPKVMQKFPELNFRVLLNFKSSEDDFPTGEVLNQTLNDEAPVQKQEKENVDVKLLFKSNPIFSEYSENLRIKLLRKVRSIYGNSSFNNQKVGDVYLAFRLTQDGKIDQLRILDEYSTDDYDLQDLALEAFENAAPFGVIPKQIQMDKNTTLEIQISFKIIEEEFEEDDY